MTSQPPSLTLLVNVDLADRSSQAEILEEMGYGEIRQAGSGNEAWSIMKDEPVNLVICAWLLLREMSGLGLLQLIRSEPAYSTLPFLLIAENITKEMVVEAVHAGVSDIIIQPFDKELFQKKVVRSVQGEEDTQKLAVDKLMHQGETLIKKGRLNDALASFNQVLKVYKSAEVYYNLGYIRTAQGRYEEALAAFRKATQIDQAFAKAYEKMAEVYKRLGRIEEAQSCMEKAADIYLTKKQDQNAEKAFMKVLQINPNTPNVFNSLGIVLRRQGKLEESARMYKRALKVNPFDEHIHYNLARVYIGGKKLTEASQVLKNALKINPDFVEARNLLQSLEMGCGL